MRRIFRRLASRSERLGELWELAKSERSSPPQTGLSVAVGVFSACTPFIGFHMWIALGLATALRLNRLWAFIGSRLSVGPVFAGIVFCEIESGHRLRSGHWMPLALRDAVAHLGDLIVDCLVGTPIVGGGIAAAAGLAAYALARRRRALRG